MKSKELKNIPELRFPEFLNDGEWEEKELRNLITYFKGFAFQSKDYTSNGRRIVRVSDMGFDYIKDKTNAIYINEQKANEFEKWKLQKNDLVITTVGSKPPVYDSLVGRTIIVQTKDEDSLLNQNAVCLRAKKIEQGFLNVLFKRSEYVSFIESIIRGNANQGSIALEDLFKYMCFIPSSTKEQQKIADCLSSLDNLITVQSKKVETLKEHKKGLMQQLFPQEGEKVPKLRFPEFENEPEWEEKTLSKVGEIITGNTPPTANLENYGGSELFVSPADISDKRYITTTKTTLSKQGFKQTRQIKANSILVVCIGSTIGKVAQNKFDCATNQQINSIVPFDEYSNDFVYSALENSSSRIASLAGNHAVPIINKSSFSSVLILCPLFPEQQKIADCLSSIDELITSSAKKVETLKEHKKGLMQKLFPAGKEEVN